MSDTSSSIKLRIPPNYKIEFAGLTAILLLAALLRLGWAGINSFDFDEARLSLIALDMARAGAPALLGMPSSAALPNPPAAAWIFSLPYSLSVDPLVATAFVGILNIVAIGGLWWLVRGTWEWDAALLAAFLAATLPYTVIYARNIWAQNLLGPLAILWAACAVLGIRNRINSALIAHYFLAVTAWQVHYAGIALLIGTVCLVLIFQLWNLRSQLFIGIGLGALAALPFLFGIRCCAPEFGLVANQSFSQSISIDAIAFRDLIRLAVGYRWTNFFAGGGMPSQDGLSSLLLGIGVVTLALGGLWGGLRSIWNSLRKPTEASRQDVTASLLPLWVVAAPLTFTVHFIPVNQHYMLVSLPAVYIAAGAGLRAIHNQRLRKLILGLAILLCLWQAVWVGRSLDFIQKNHTPNGMIRTPLLYPRAVAQSLMTDNPVSVHSFSDEPDYNADPAKFKVLFWEYPHRLVDGTGSILIPSGGAELLFVRPDVPALAVLTGMGNRFPRSEYPRSPGDVPYVVLSALDQDLVGFENINPVNVGESAKLTGYRIDTFADSLRLSLRWIVLKPPVPVDLHRFIHLYSEPDDEFIIGNDGGVSSRSWEIGDLVVTWGEFELTVIPEMYYFNVGMYSYPDLTRLNWHDAHGQSIGDIHKLGPFIIDKP